MAGPSSATKQRRPGSPPDLALVAREAVVSFLRDESAAASEREAVRAGDIARDAKAAEFGLQKVAVHAAVISVATLERIESAAARLEADIAEARTEQAEIQARAGMAAEGAVRAAHEAWAAAGTAEESSRSARMSVRRVGRYASVTVVLVAVQLLIVVLFASSSH